MAELTVRLAQTRDAERIWRINQSALGYDFPLDRTRERLELILRGPANRVFVACDEGGEVIGYLHAADYECTYSESMKNILALAVSPERQGMGAGRRLLEAAEQWARETGSTAVRLVSGFDRTEAHRFYAHCGYRLRKEEKNFIKNV